MPAPRIVSVLAVAAALTLMAGCSSDEGAQREQSASTAVTEGPASAPWRSDVEIVPVTPTALATEIVAQADRTDKDRETDKRRHPADLLTFMRVTPGQRVADLSAGSGYTTELLVRTVGPKGVVFAQNNASTIEKFVKTSWPERLAREVNKDVIRVDAESEAPLPPEATDLDTVTLIFSYHDVVAAGSDRAAMNQAVFNALKPGGVFVIADHHAPEGSGIEAAGTLHRLERDIVIQEVSAAGFELNDEGEFLRDPTDDLSAVSYKIGFKTDRYVLLFEKPR